MGKRKNKKQAINDVAMEWILFETSKTEDEIDWAVVADHAETIACDA